MKVEHTIQLHLHVGGAPYRLQVAEFSLSLLSRSFLIVCGDAVCHPAFLNKRRYDNSASTKGPEGHYGVGATCNATAKAEFELLFLEIKSITCFLNFLTSNKITSPMTCIEPRGI